MNIAAIRRKFCRLLKRIERLRVHLPGIVDLPDRVNQAHILWCKSESLLDILKSGIVLTLIKVYVVPDPIDIERRKPLIECQRE